MLFSTEARLALQAALCDTSSAHNAFAQWQARVDLDHLPAGHYPLLPLISNNLESHGIDHPWSPRLRGIHRKTWYANQLTLHAAADIVQELQNNGVQPVAVGALALAPTVYPDLGLRPMQPLEIFVPASTAAPAIQAMLALGWRPEPAAPHLLSPEFRAWVPGQRFINPQRQAIWLSWHVMPAVPCTELDATCLAAARPLAIETTSMTTLCPTDHLLRACLTDGAGALIALTDATFLLRHSTIDWQRLMATASTYDLVLPVRSMLEVLVQEVGATVPAAVLTKLRDAPASAVAVRRHRIAGVAPTARTLADRAWWLWLHYRRALACRGGRPGLRTLTAFAAHNQRLASRWELPAVLLRRVAGRPTVTHGAQ